MFKESLSLIQKPFLKLKSNPYFKVLPYLIIILATCLSLGVYFQDGIMSADDLHCHLAQSYDVYYGLKNGYLLPTSNHVVYGYLAYNMIESYAPFPHYMVGLLAFLFEWAGMDIIIAYKFFIIAMTSLGGIFMYRFLYTILDKKAFPALIGALIFAIYPYRIFHIICRASFSESVAISMAPLLFLGIAKLLKSDPYEKVSLKPYLYIGLGTSLMLLSHVLTTIYVVIFAAIYLLLRIKDVYKLFSLNKRSLVLSIVTIFVTSLCLLPYIYVVYEINYSGIYRVGDASIFKTTLQDIYNEIAKASIFTGLRIFNVTSDKSGADSLSQTYYIIWDVVIYALSLFILDQALKDKLKRRYLYLIALCLSLLYCLAVQRYEAVAAGVVALIIYIYVKESIAKIGADNKPYKFDYRPLVDIFYCAVMITLLVIAIYTKEVWDILPSFFYKVQFPFRYFIYIPFFAGLALASILSYCHPKLDNLAKLVGVGAVMFCFIYNQASIEKRYASSFYYSWSVESCYGSRDGGLQREYLPSCILDEDYVSEYSNSLLSKVRRMINYDNYSNNIEDYLTPVALEGMITSVSVDYLNTPSVSFSITVSETTLVQIPQIYYDGYEIDLDHGKTTAFMVDGLVSFYLEEGSYKVDVSYQSPKVSRYLSFVYSFALVGVSLYATNHFQRKKDFEIENGFSLTKAR